MKAVAQLVDAAGQPLSGRLQIVVYREDGQKAVWLEGVVEKGQWSGEIPADPFASPAAVTPTDSAPTAREATTRETTTREAATLSSATLSAELAEDVKVTDAAVSEATSTRKTYSLSELVSGAGAQVGTASTSVSTSGVSLGEVKLTIRGVAAPTEAGAVGLSLDETSRDGAVLSELSTRYVPGQPTAPTGTPAAESAAPATPDLRGYTRQMAARKLAGLGLQATFATLSVPPGSPDLGRVVRQSPPPGAPASPGGTLRLFLGA